MIISFFEEFPNKSNLSKLDLINFNTKLYLAAKSYKEFKKIKIKNRFIKELIYWPILEKNEGYWISPFSDYKALLRIFNEKINNKIMLDLELPKNRFLMIKNLFNFSKNKKLIRNFINDKTYTAEYYPQGRFKDKIFNFLGLNFSDSLHKNKVIKMLYHSMHNFNENFIIKEISYGIKNYKEKYLLAFGTIAKGINKNELLLSLEQLDKDLRIAKELNVSEVIIYRLGGLNKKYINIMKKYV